MLMTLSYIVPSAVVVTICTFMQNDVNALADCISSSLLNLNPTKCKYMIITRKRKAILPPTPLTVMGNTLDKVSSFKYLGVWITKDRSWSKHVSEKCIKAKKVIGLIYRQTTPRVCRCCMGSSPAERY